MTERKRDGLMVDRWRIYVDVRDHRGHVFFVIVEL